MEFFALNDYLDLIGYGVIVVLATLALNRWARKKTGTGLGWKPWATMETIAAASMVLALMAESYEHRQLERTVSGLAPTYADEMYRLGHEKMSVNTPAEDPVYLKMIQTEIRWQQENPEVADIYTFGRSNGKNVLLVDSETDYDHNGLIEGEREQRTAVGEEYDEDPDLLDRAFGGEAVFTPKPTSDRWGTWISTYVPMRNSQGQVIAVLGVDYEATRWIRALLWRRVSMLALGGILASILIGSMAITTMMRSEMKKRETLSEQLMEVSRRAGMAEIATGVLHNVGNALNSINISAGVISEKLRSAEATPAEIQQAARMLSGAENLGAFLENDEAGKQLPAYFCALAESMAQEHKSLETEMGALTRGIEHVKEIVRSQQDLSKHRGIAARVHPQDLFEEALTISKLSIERHGIDVLREFAAVPEAVVDRNRTLQILVNLVSNAVRAIKEVPATQRKGRLTVRLAMGEMEAGRQMLEWQVEDSGVGIRPENLKKIFQHGFTTRADGHGFGLHVSANAAGEMGGRIKVHSDGAGRGARFTLIIPLGQDQLTPTTTAASQPRMTETSR